MELPKIVTTEGRLGEKFLRKKVSPFDFSKFTKKDIKSLVSQMALAMREANGIGLSANQINLNYRVFIAKPGKKLYVVFNPEIVKSSELLENLEEGCLSVPSLYGEVSRFQKISVMGFTEDGKRKKYKINGLLARVFQHEIDHLNGELFIYKAKEVRKVE